MNTPYTVHHETSHAQSRKLTLWFWGGVLFSFLSYSAIAWLFLTLFFGISGTAPDSLPTYAILTGLATSLIVLYGYYLARSEAQSATAAARAAALGASPLDKPQHPAERQYRNIVEEMSVAAGIRPPDILLCHNDNSINAFVIGGAGGSIAVAVSAGALRYLDRDELQALVAHEFGHIVDGDIPLYGRLTAMIHGYRFLAEQGRSLLYTPEPALNTREQMLIDSADPANDAEAHAIRQLAYASASRRMESEHDPEGARSQFMVNGYGCLLSLLILILSAYSVLLTFYARLMQAAIVREREWMADAKAVQFTRNSGALANLFRKVLARQRAQPLPAPVRLENRHLLLINYLQKHGDQRLHTHPDTIERLKRYGDYRHEDIERLAYALAEYPPYDHHREKPERSQTHFADALFPYMLLRHHAQTTLPAHDSSAVILACLMRLANATPKGLLHSGKLHADTLRPVNPVWQQLLPAHQAVFLPLLLNRLAELPAAQLADLPIAPIIQADNALSFSEWCAHTAWKIRQHPLDPRELPRHEAEPHIRTLLRLAAHLSAADETARAALYAELPRHTLPIAAESWRSVTTRRVTPVPCKAPDEKGWPIEPLTTPDARELGNTARAISELRRLRPLYQQSLIQGLAATLQQHEPLPLDAYGYLHLLETLLTPKETP